MEKRNVAVVVVVKNKINRESRRVNFTDFSFVYGVDCFTTTNYNEIYMIWRHGCRTIECLGFFGGFLKDAYPQWYPQPVKRHES